MVKSSWYEEPVQIRFCDCDPQHRVKPSALCRILADLAGVAFAARGMDHAYLWEHGYVFLLSRVSVRIFRVPQADEMVKASTWEREVRRAEYLRDFELHSADGDLLAAATTSWVLVSPKTRQILRPSEFDGELLPTPERKADAPECVRLRLKEADAEQTDSRKIYYSHLDGNGHVYNAVYADLAMDALPRDLLERPLRELQLNFCREAMLDDRIAICRQIQEHQALVKGTLDGKDCFLCQMIYE